MTSVTPGWRVLATAELADGSLLELHQRGATGDAPGAETQAETDFVIYVDGRVLMNSFSRSSEEALSQLTLAGARTLPAPRVLIGGLGMGFTLRAALDQLPPGAEVVVAELNAVVVEWCQGPLAAATDHALADPRVRVELGDVAALIERSPPDRFDVILLDLYEGPNDASQGRNDPFYGAAALAQQRRALAPGGALGIWSEELDEPYARRLAAAGFEVATHVLASGETQHVVYLGTDLGTDLRTDLGTAPGSTL